MTTTRIEPVADGIRVTGEMTVYTAGQIKQPLLDALVGGSTNIEVDLSGVSEFDTAGLQLLLLIHREALVRGRTLRFAAASGIVREVLRLYGALGLLTDFANLAARP